MLKTPLRLKQLLARHGDGFVACGLLFVAFVLINHVSIQSYRQYFIDQNTADVPEVAVVLGGGISGGKPRPLLKGRLDTAAALYEQGVVSRILVSGDNRYENYNEPAVMNRYLVEEKNLPDNVIHQDMAGRSTYETCERASKIFQLDRIVLVSERTHLPRAIYLCRSFGLEAYGAPSQAEAASGLRLGQRWRELLASQKAFVNVYVKGEDTVLGEPLPIQ